VFLDDPERDQDFEVAAQRLVAGWAPGSKIRCRRLRHLTERAQNAEPDWIGDHF
jgi:hypothetical protein